MFRERVHRLTVYTLFEDTSKLAIDGYAVGGDGDQSGLNLIVVILLLAALVHSVSGYFLETVWAFLGQRVLYALRMSMVNHLQRLSIAFYDRSQVGRVMSRLQNDVRELSVFWYMIASTTPNVLTSGIIVVSCLQSTCNSLS